VGEPPLIVGGMIASTVHVLILVPAFSVMQFQIGG
jgi:hypothetical protein